MSAELHTRIRRRLDATGKSMRRVSLDAGLSQEALSTILRKPDQSQTLETIQKLASGLETTPAWLAFGVGSEEGDPAAQAGQSSGPSKSMPLYRNQLPDSVRIQVEVGEIRTGALRILALAKQKKSAPDTLADLLISTLADHPDAFAVVPIEAPDHSDLGSPARVHDGRS